MKVTTTLQLVKEANEEEYLEEVEGEV